MIGILFGLVIVGVILYFLEQIPMDATIRTLIKVVIVLFALFWLFQFFMGVGGANFAFPTYGGPHTTIVR